MLARLSDRLALTPAARLAVGLASLMVCLFLLLDFALGLTTNQANAVRKARRAVAESIAVQIAGVLPSNDARALDRLLRDSVARNDELRAIGVRRQAGNLVGATPGHAESWQPPPDGRSTIDQMQLPVQAGKETWGTIEFSFQPFRASGWRGLLDEPALQVMAGLSLIGGLAFYLYLRRALQYLDPSSAVPERVRAAFDTLTEGLLVLDIRGRVVLVNQAFRRLLPSNAGSLSGRSIGSMGWLAGSLGEDPANHPWTRAMIEGQVITVESFSLVVPGTEEPRHFVVKANPIIDSGGAKRGCLVTFDDVTRLHEMNLVMRRTMQELEASREQIQLKNEELQRLASRDPLTGCMNRRSFFDGLEKMQKAAAAAGEQLAFIMCDVDHFKTFNDRFGHALGDQVLIAMGRILASQIREGDLLCRMGGEEFCIASRGLSVERVIALAEKIRLEVETTAGNDLGVAQPLKVTSSFGVAAMPAATVQAAHLLELADQALYHAKRGGRNRVVSWPFERDRATGEMAAVV